jgi:hypothetical protein
MSKIKMIFLGLLDREKVRERETGGGQSIGFFFFALSIHWFWPFWELGRQRKGR